ncbi:MAG: redoxin domain-containing protein [Phycisphaerae bacterium]|nr:redoxin domain-containing protein [Phycisphaerae bacterium]
MNKPFAALFASCFAASFAFVSIAGDPPATGTPAVKHEKHEKKEEKKHEAGAEKGTKAEVGKTAPNFTLKTAAGKDWSLSDAAGKIVVLEWINPNCPVCQRVMKDGTVATTLKEVTAISPDVVYVAINSSAADPASLDGTAKYMTDMKMTMPALLDRDGKVGMTYGAKTTPHCYVIDAKGVLRYQGAIDDNAQGSGAKMNYVVNAVKQIKAGETVSPDSTKSYGCGVKYANK